MIEVDELLTYLHRQIDPQDSHNPKYQELWRQIEHIRRAKADYMAASVPPLRITRGQAISLGLTVSDKQE